MSDFAFYCCTDKSYIPRAVTALKSIQRFVPDVDYFVSTDTSQLSADQIACIEAVDLKVLHTDFSEQFPKGCQKWKPIMYWIYGVPAMLEKAGYKHCCAIDGDVLGCRPFSMDWLSKVGGVACVKNPPRYDSGGQLLKKKFEWFKKRYGIRRKDIDKPNTNSGVIWFNTQTMRELGFFEQAVDVYTEVMAQQWKGCWLNDQALFAVMQCILGDRLPIHRVSDRWHYRFHKVWMNPELKKEKDPKVYICHFIGIKPWQPDSEHRKAKMAGPQRMLFINRWRQFNQELGFQWQ